MKLTIKEIINNAIDEMQRAQDAIKTLYERLGEPIGSNTAISDDEMLIEDMNSSIERLATIENTILVALNLAVYAGNIEASGKGFINDFGADSLAHREEYLAFAEQYDLPYEDDGLIATDCVYNDVSEYAQSKYATKRDATNLPTELYVNPTDIYDDWYEMDEDERGEAVSDYLSCAYEFCHYGFEYEETDGQIHITHIEWDEEE